MAIWRLEFYPHTAAMEKISPAPMKVRKRSKAKARDKAMEAADEIAFMDAGKIVERGTYDDFFNKPKTDRAKLFLSQILD